MPYKYFGRLAGKTHTAEQSLVETSPPNTLTPFNPQAPATKLLAYGEDATSLAFNRAFSALSANIDYVSSILDGPAVRDEILAPYRKTVDGDWTEGSWTHGSHVLGQTGDAADDIVTGKEFIHLANDTGSDDVPIYWVHVGLHKKDLQKKVTFYRSQNQPLGGPANTGASVLEEHVAGTPNPEITGDALATVTHTARPADAFLTSQFSGTGASYFDFDYKLTGTQVHLGSKDHGVTIHVPPVERMRPNLTPFAGDHHSEGIYKWDTDGVYLKSVTFSDLYLRPGCFVEISGDGDEGVNHGNNGLFQIASIGRSDHLPSLGGPGDKAILTRGGLCRVTVRDWRVFGRGELVSWASAPNHMDQTEDTAQKPGLRKNYAHVAYVIPRPDVSAQVDEMPGDLYLAIHSVEDDLPALDGHGYKAAVPGMNAADARYHGRYKHGDIGSPDQEGVVRDHNGVIIMDALQNHGILPGTRLYHGHAHFYPMGTPWNMGAWATAYSEVMGEADGVPDGIIGPGEPVVFDTGTVPGKVWPCSPPGFILNPSFQFNPENALYVGEYYGKAETLCTVKEKLVADSSISEADKNPEHSLLRAWHKFIRTGHLSASNAPDTGTGHSTNDLAGIHPPKRDDLNALGSPTKTILGGDLWHVEFEWDSGEVYASLEEAYAALVSSGTGTEPFVGDFAKTSVGGEVAPQHRLFVNPTNPGLFGTARFSSVSGNEAVLFSVLRKRDSHVNSQSWDGWTYGRENWPITEGSEFTFETDNATTTTWKVKTIRKAPYVDDAWGRGMVPGTGLNAAYHNEYSSDPGTRGDLFDDAHSGGSGGTLWINPGRPFTTILPGGDQLTMTSSSHAGGWASAQGEVAHLTRSNNQDYISLHRLCSRNSNAVRAEVAVRDGSASARMLADASNPLVTRVYSETLVGGLDTSVSMLLTDDTTQTHGDSPEIGTWNDLDVQTNLMHSTHEEGGYPKHGVFLSNNLSKVTQDQRSPFDFYKQPSFDARSTPMEVQDRSILGAIEGVLLGNFNPFSNDSSPLGDGNRGLNDFNNFGTWSNGIIKGGKAWCKLQDGHIGAPTAATFLDDDAIWICEAYLHVGGAKWYQPDFTLSFADGTWLLSWDADKRQYVREALDIDVGTGNSIDIGYFINNERVTGQGANKIPCYIVSAAGGVVESLTDVRFRVNRQDQKTNIYVGRTNPLHGKEDQVHSNGGYIDDSMNFETLGEAFAALSFWCRGALNRNWTIEVVAPTYESYWRWDLSTYDSYPVGDDGPNVHGISFPIKMPCNGITVRGLPGRNAGDGIDDSTYGASSGYGKSGWARPDNKADDDSRDELRSPVVYWKHYLQKPEQGLFDLNGRFGITFENLSFHYQGEINESYSTHGDWGNIARDVPQDVIFYAGNEAYLNQELTDLDPDSGSAVEHGRDREAFDHLYGSRDAPPNTAYCGGWSFKNLYIRGGGGLLTTLDAMYSIDNVNIRDCQAHDVMSFVTMGIDCVPYPGGEGSWLPQQNGKHHTRITIENNTASFPANKHLVNGQWGNPFISGTLTHWVPGTFDPNNITPDGTEVYNDLFGVEHSNNDGEDGEITPNRAKYMCGVYASQCKEIHVRNNTFKSFYAGVIFGRALKLHPTPDPNYDQEPYCEGWIEGNTIQNTQSHGIYVLSQSHNSNIHIKDNTIKDPGIPFGAGEHNTNTGHPNIFDWEAWGIKICAGSIICTGNSIRNTWRTSPELNYGSFNAGWEHVDRTGVEYYARLYPYAGAIYMYSLKDPNTLPNPSEILGEGSARNGIIAHNQINVAGRAVYGILLAPTTVGVSIDANHIEYENSPIAEEAPDYGSSYFNDHLPKFPWSVWVDKDCSGTHITSNVLQANVWLGEKCENSIVSGNTVRMPYELHNPVQVGDGGCLIRTNSWSTSIIDNKMHCGLICLGSTGTAVHNSRVAGNDLTPFGEVTHTTNFPPVSIYDAIQTGIYVSGSGSNVTIDGNNTNGGDILAVGAGTWHSMKVINNNTGMHDTGYLHPSNAAIIGGRIWVEKGDSASIQNNDTAGGYIAMGEVGAWGLTGVGGNTGSGTPDIFWVYNGSIVNNRTFGGGIYAAGDRVVIKANNTCNSNVENPPTNSSGEIHVYNSQSSIISGNNIWSGITVQQSDRGTISDNNYRAEVTLIDSPFWVISDNNGQPIASTNPGYRPDIIASNCDNISIAGNVTAGGFLGEAGYGMTNHAPINQAPYQAPNSWQVTNYPGVWDQENDDNGGGPNSNPNYHGGGPPPATSAGTLGQCGGEIRLTSCSRPSIRSNVVSRIKMDNCGQAFIDSNTCWWGGARPKNSNNIGIQLLTGYKKGYVIQNNKSMGTIKISGRPSIFGDADGGKIANNKVGTSTITGEIYWGTSPQLPSFEGYMMTVGDWRGGGGHIIVDDVGGLQITGNHSLTDMGTLPDTAVNNPYNGCEWGSILLNSGGKPSLEVNVNTNLWTWPWTGMSVHIADNHVGTVRVTMPSWRKNDNGNIQTFGMLTNFPGGADAALNDTGTTLLQGCVGVGAPYGSSMNFGLTLDRNWGIVNLGGWMYQDIAIATINNMLPGLGAAIALAPSINRGQDSGTDG